MIRYKLLIPTLLLAFVVGFFPHVENASTQAQGDSPPIIFVRNGDIYSYNTQTFQMTQLTTWAHNEAPVMSPDGKRFVYNSWASQFVETLGATPGGYIGAPPSNIWMWEIATGDAVRIAEQPANMIPPSTTDGGNGIIRSRPVWSPDGAEVAWTEAQLPDYAYRLVAYNFATGETRVVATGISMGFQDGGVVLQNPTWGSGGIALTRWDGGANGFEQTLTVYNPNNGAIIYNAVVNNGDDGVLENVWLDDIENAIGLAFRGHWEMINVATGIRAQVEGVGPYSRLAPSNTNFRPTAIYTPSAIDLRIPAGGGNIETASIARLNTDVAVSPDGNNIAFVNDALYVNFTNTASTLVNGTNFDNTQPYAFNHGVAWGAVGWRTISNDIAAPIVKSCPQLPRLSTGGRARVIPGQGGGNALRGLPQTGEFSEELTVIPENGTMDVLAGPVCFNDLYWWLVAYNDVRGWTAEADATGYWLEPIQ